MKIILCCYNRVGCNVLKQVANSNEFDDIAVFTHATSGEHDVRQVAQELGITYSVEKINNSELPFKPDVISSVYYRYIINETVINACDGKIFNAHPSLLPKHRGCSSVPWAIIGGDTTTGVTFHYIDTHIDTGRIILQSAIQIDDDTTQLALYDKCMDRIESCWDGAWILVREGFAGIGHEGKSSYHKRGVPHGGEINEEWDDDKIERFIRAMYYPPLSGAKFKGVEITSIEQYKKIRGI